MCVCVCVCVFLHANWLSRAMGVAYFKKVRNFQMDSQICTRFSVQVGHES